MDAKEIKAHLKDAREAIRLKDFEGAATHCKAILSKEATNYNALVFLGVSYEGTDQAGEALTAYKKATSECPDQPLAWQGIASILDKNPDLLDLQEKVAIFEKLQSFTAGNEGKRISYLHKLLRLYLEGKLWNKAYDTAEELLGLENDDDGRISTCKAMVDLLALQDISADKVKCDKYNNCLDEVLKCLTPDDKDIDKYTRLFLFPDSKMGDNSLSMGWKDLHQKFPQAAPPLEFGLQSFLEKTVVNADVSKETVEEMNSLCKELQGLRPDNDMVKAILGFSDWRQHSFITAIDHFKEMVNCIACAQYYLCQSYLKQRDLTNCLQTCSAGLQTCSGSRSIINDSKDQMVTKFKLVQAEAHRLQGSEEDQQKCLAILEEIKDVERHPAVIIQSYLYIDQGRIEDAQNCIESVTPENSEVKMINVAVLLAQKQFNKAYDILQDILTQEPDHGSATLKKGIVLWELRNSADIENVKQQCFTFLLKAAKLDPYNYESFLYLGHFYDQIQRDANKAVRCYRKSYDLNPLSDDAGCSYVDCLLEQDSQQSQAVDILRSVTSKAPAGRSKWAWLRLGLYQMKHEDPSNAITSLQAALRADPKDNHVWECLSEAYLHRGSLTAALKAFTKASELNPESTYCQYQIASIKQTLGLLPEAVKEYKEVLELDSTYVAALKGLGESLIMLAKQNLHQCLDGLTQDNIEEAITVLTRAASHRPDFSCLWKLLGDCCTLVSCLASNCFRVPSKLLDKSSDHQKHTEITKEQLLQIGSRCYSQAIQIMPENGSLWHSLGINLYHQSCHQARESHHHQSAKELLVRAKKALENALKLDTTNWRHWNAMGVISCSKVDSKLSFAQHCFIKSVECEANNVVAWSNLGVLYMSQGNIALSHDAFKVAQRLDPTYMVGWLGQALVAETVGHEEALDLFRHTTELGSHLESEIGYGHQVLSMLKDKTKQDTELFHYCIHRMAAIPAAADALIKYTARVQTDPVAYNMLGLLLEHQKLIKPSVDAFSKSLKLLDGNINKELESQVRLNYARALCTLGMHKESLEQFGMIESDMTLEHILTFALAAYKAGNYIDSFKLYKVALDQVPEENDLKSQLYVALAMVAFKVDDLDEAKTQLFNGFQTESPSLHGLLAMCALGLHQEDMTLAIAALEELNKRPDGREVVDKIAKVTLCKLALEGTIEEGEVYVREMIESHSKDAARLWPVLASLLVSRYSSRGADALESLKTLKTINGSLKLPEIVTNTLAQLQAGLHNQHDIDSNALKTAQRAFHLNPGDVSAIATLACALHGEGVLKRQSNGHAKFFKTEKELLTLLSNILEDGNNPTLLFWCLQQLAVCCIELGDEGEARKLLHVLEEGDDTSKSFAKAVQLFLYSTSIDKWSKLENMLAIQIVCAIMAEEQDEFSVVSEILQRMVENPVGDQGKLLQKDQLLELWTHAAFKGMKKKLTEQKQQDLKDLLNKGLLLAREEEIKSPVISLIQGLYTYKSSKSDAKHYFATALDQSGGRTDASNIKSVARKGLLTFLKDSTKTSNTDLIQALVDDAKSEHDATTEKFYKTLFNIKM